MSDRWNCFRASCSCSCRGGHEHGHRSAMRGIYPQIATSFSLRNFPKVTTKFFAPNSQKSKCQLRRYDDQCINSNKDIFGNANVINPTEITHDNFRTCVPSKQLFVHELRMPASGIEFVLPKTEAFVCSQRRRIPA